MNNFIDLLFPPKCAICGKACGKSAVCGVCLLEIMREAKYNCKNCANPPYLCNCKKINNIESLAFPFFYDSNKSGSKFKSLIFKLKQANLYYINEFFAKSMYNCLKNGDKIKLEDIDFVCCVPRKRKSVIKYGYNQAEELAKIIASLLNKKYIKILKCNNYNYSEQKELKAEQRRINVINQFFINKKINLDLNNLNNLNALIIDDVATTGSTVAECARILKCAGIKKVYALCVCAVIM